MRRMLLAVVIPAAAGITSAVPNSDLRAQAPAGNRPLVLKCNDDDGPGRLTISRLEPAGDGASPIKVVLEQHGARFTGSGVAYPIEAKPPFKTLYAFAVTSPKGSYFF